MIDVAAGAAKKIFGEDGVLEAPQMMGGEDFSYYQEKIPGAMVLLAQKGQQVPPGFQCDRFEIQHKTPWIL